MKNEKKFRPKKNMNNSIWIFSLGLLLIIALTIIVIVQSQKNQTTPVTITITPTVTPTITPIPDIVYTQILWKESAQTSGNLIGSWSEVCELISKNNGILTIYVDDSLAPCVVNQTINCQSRVQFFSDAASLQFLDGFSLIDPIGFGGALIVEFLTTGTPNIIMQNTGVLQMIGYSVLTNAIENTSPGIKIADNESMVLTFNMGSIVSLGSTNIPLIQLGKNSQLTFAPSGSTNPSGFENDIISSTDSSSVLQYLYDSQSPRITNTGFLGTLTESPLSESKNTFFDNTVVSANFGDDVQTAIDSIKQIFIGVHPVPGDMNFNNHNISSVQTATITNLTLGINPNSYNMPITTIPNAIDSVLLYNGTPNLVFREPMYGTATLITGTIALPIENTWYPLNSGTFTFVGSPNVIIVNNVRIKNNASLTRPLQIVCNLSCTPDVDNIYNFGIRNNNIDSGVLMRAFIQVTEYHSIGFSHTFTSDPGTDFQIVALAEQAGSFNLAIHSITVSIV
jgi:hypothetical protein